MIIIYRSEFLFHKVGQDCDGAYCRLLDLVRGAAEEGLEAAEEGLRVLLAEVEVRLEEVDDGRRGDELHAGRLVLHPLDHQLRDLVAELLLDVGAEVRAQLRDAVHGRVAHLRVDVRQKVPRNTKN